MSEPMQMKKKVTTRSQPEEESGDSDINEQVDAVMKGIERGNFTNVSLAIPITLMKEIVCWRDIWILQL